MNKLKLLKQSREQVLTKQTAKEEVCIRLVMMNANNYTFILLKRASTFRCVLGSHITTVTKQ